MKNLLKVSLLTMFFLATASTVALAQEYQTVPEGQRMTCYHVYSKGDAQKFSPKRGDWSVGVTFNPATLGYQLKMQPKNGEYAGAFIADNATAKKQMFILSQDPLAAVRVRYYFNESWALRMTLGLNGSHVDYKEYVQDDLAKAIDPNSENKVVDNVISNLNSGSLAVAAQYMAGKGSLKFITGFGLVYAIAGVGLNFNYGNKITDLNKVPSSMPMTMPPATGAKDPTLNDFQSTLGIAYGRPLKRYNVGYVQGLGITADMGVEWFMTGRLSLTATMTFTPVMAIWQPKTYAIYEGFSSRTGKVEQYNSLVSPGSHAWLYGTENIGCNLSLNYYF